VAVRSIPRQAWLLVAGASAALLFVTLFFSGGTNTERLLPLALSALFVAGGALVASFAGLLPVPEVGIDGIALFGLLCGFVVWSGLSVAWSIAPDLSWDMFNREVAYLAFAVAGVYVGALVPRALWGAATAFAVLLGAVIAWALAGKVFPSLVSDLAITVRLRSPVGCWNALALLCVAAFVLALWLVTDAARARATRVAGVVLAYGALVAVVLTYSRSGIALAVLAGAAWLALSGSALETLAALVVAGVAAAPVLAFALTRPGIADEGQSHATRVHDGALFAPVLVGGALVAALLAVALLRAAARRPPSQAARRRLVAGTLGAAALVAVAALGISVVHAGGPGAWIDARAHDFATSAPLARGSTRLGSLSSDNRWDWWQEAWRSFEHAPAIGRGAGSFPIAHLLERRNDTTVTEPHNFPLQALSDTGAIGFLLLLGAIVAAFVAVRRGLGRLTGRERLAGLALALAAAAYVLQSLVDVDWDFVAISGPVLFVLGLLAARGSTPRAVRPVATWGVGGAVLVSAAALSLLFPWLSNQEIDRADAALSTDPAAAVRHANDAHSLNPLAVQPLYALAGAEYARGRPGAAALAYARAVRLQPDNPQTWYLLGSFELDVLGYRPEACRHLTRSFELDPYEPGVRAARNEACR
jgi:tetratricopeptide (TPR) repeat protein